MSPLAPADHVWLRLWHHRHHGASIAFPAPIPELEYDPWPALDDGACLLTTIPPSLRHLPWVKAPGGSSHIATYLGDSLVLRLAVGAPGRDRLEREARALSSGSRFFPALLEQTKDWLVAERLPGTRPVADGPWLEDLAVAVREGLFKDPALLPSRPASDLGSLVRLLGVPVVAHLAMASTTVSSSTATHGDLHCGNILVDAEGRLGGVLDFENAYEAPLECEAAVWLTVLTGQIGLAPVRRLARHVFPTGASGTLLRHELLRHLDSAAQDALGSGARPEHRRTVVLLAQMLADDPDLPLRLLGMPTTDGQHPAHL